ncbi:hypothetical protein [Timonella sp. A28]|uniref:hypothetical protein n=1 Tax=Timonella sp. A28 TaxID=3442640 RepID=UPI003EB6C5D9
MRSYLRFAISVVVTIAVALTGVGMAAAVEDSGKESYESKTERISEQGNGVGDLDVNPSRYDNKELLQLLFAGIGPIADSNPEIVNQLGFDPNRPKVDSEQLSSLIEEFLDFYPDFDKQVRDRLSSGNPKIVEIGLVRLTEAYQDFLEVHYAEDLKQLQSSHAYTTAAKGCTSAGAKVCVIAYAGALVNAGIYANVAVATMAVLAVAVVATLGVVTWYLEDDKTEAMGTRIERESMVATMAKVLHIELSAVD